MIGKPKLTPKQQKFIKEYLVDLNATQAAIRAGYSKKTAGQIGEQNLKKLEIQEELKKRQNKISEKTEYDAEAWRKDLIVLKDRFMQEMPILDAEGNVFLDENGKQIVRTSEPGAALKAIEMLGRHMGLFNDKLTLKGDPEEILAAARKRVKK